jgi:hypothetical protein
MSNPYMALGQQLFAAARRGEVAAHPGARRSLRDRPLLVAVLALVLVLAGTAITLAASGLLDGSAVKPSRGLNPKLREGIPGPGGSRLLPLDMPDPQGGPSWGVRIVHTTRGEVCLQIGRLRDGQLGELGIDGAFGNDGRFHALPPDALPTNGPENSNTACALAGQSFTGSFTHLDRNAARTLEGTTPSTGNPREVSFGLLGSHALNITYRTAHGLRTGRVTKGAGAYLIVEPPSRLSQGGGSSGYDSPTKRRPSPWGALSAITYRFGKLVCSDGAGAEVTTHCPPPSPAPASTINSTRSLHQSLHVTLDIRHHLIHDAELEFTAPYAATSAHQGYEIVKPILPSCGQGGGNDPLERDIKQGQKIRIKLAFPFQFANKCGPKEVIQVRFVNPEGPSAISTHESVIVGSITIAKPAGTHTSPTQGN